MKVFGIVPAAGSGQRLGNAAQGLPKALVPVAGKPLVIRSVEALLESYPFTALAIAAPEAFLNCFRELRLPPQVTVCEGGDTRVCSVKNAASSLHLLSENDVIVIHDAARCFVSREVVVRTIKACLEYGAVTAAIPSSDTLKFVDQQQQVIETLNRARIWRTQTPQVFRWGILKRALEGDLSEATDEASLVEQLHPVRCVLGAEENFKITFPNDLLYAEYLLSREE